MQIQNKVTCRAENEVTVTSMYNAVLPSSEHILPADVLHGRSNETNARKTAISRVWKVVMVVKALSMFDIHRNSLTAVYVNTHCYFELENARDIKNAVT